MTESFPKPKIEINDDQPLVLDEWRDHPTIAGADPDGELPSLVLGSAPTNPRDRPRPMAQRVGINKPDGEQIGAFNLAQTGERTWINDVRIDQVDQHGEELRGKRYAVGAYVGVIAALHELERPLESDPQGLSDESVRVWESLVRRGVAQPIEGAVDVHGHPRFIAPVPQAEAAVQQAPMT